MCMQQRKQWRIDLTEVMVNPILTSADKLRLLATQTAELFEDAKMFCEQQSVTRLIKV